MLITAVAFTGTARMRDHWPVCTQYIVGPLIVSLFEDSWHVHNDTSSDSNSSYEVSFCFHKGFIHQLLYVPPKEEIQTREVR